MTPRIRSLLCVLVLLAAGTASAGFDADFTGATLRVDYHHSGTADEEHFSLDRVRIEGPWPGSRTVLLDDSNLGKYRVEVADLATHRVLYARGFASIYGEWETTGPARAGTWGTLEEAVRVPEPRRPFQLRIRKRAADQSFREVWSITVDPASRFVDRSAVPAQTVWAVLENGDPAVKVDVVILGDGYTATEMDAFHEHARAAADALFSLDPFRARKDDFNVWAIDTAAHESGVSRPRAGQFRESPLGARYNTFDSERYVLSLADRRWRDVAAAAPYDFVLLLVNERQYGGGGIFRLYSTAAARSTYMGYLVIHEFGHHFAGLGDEYYTSDTAYEDFTPPAVEPWEPNVTALLDPENLKWGDLVAEGTPLPTPWDKQAYEEASLASQARRRELRAQGASEEELEALFDAERARFTKMLAEQEYGDRVGAFEGAGYRSRGLYRPRADCIMFTRDDVGFCPVCSRALERVIDMYAR